MMMKSKAILPILTLVLCMGAFFFPATTYAQTSDTAPPTLTAELSGDTLIVAATDNDSGVESIYVDGHRFSTLVNGAASVKLSDYAGDCQQVTVYATDAAGNRSQPVLVDNPYYVEPAATQTAGSATEASPTPSPAQESVLPEPVMPDAVSDGVESDAAGTTESAIADSGTAFTPEGEGTVVDNATDVDGKEFFTVTATDGSVYYLIIDRQRGSENVYFLSAVTTDDLASLAVDGAETESGITAPTPQPLESETQPLEDEEEPPAQSGDNNGTIIFILIIVAIIGGVGYYVKVVKPRRQARQDDEEEYEDEQGDEGSGEDEYFFDRPDEEETVDKDGAASYNDTTQEETRDS